MKSIARCRCTGSTSYEKRAKYMVFSPFCYRELVAHTTGSLPSKYKYIEAACLVGTGVSARTSVSTVGTQRYDPGALSARHTPKIAEGQRNQLNEESRRPF